jgi:hypothetical protein
MAARTTVSAASTASGPDAPVRPARAASVRCNAPQRTPKAPDTPWGRLRGDRGWSLRELGALTGINAGVLSRIERDTRVTPDQARKLLAVYDGAR